MQRLTASAFFVLALIVLTISASWALTTQQRVLLGAGGPRLSLSNATIPSTASVGTTVGTLSVSGGMGTYTFTLTSNPGSLYAISGSNLNVAAALTAGSDPITIKADNGAGSVITQPFVIVVTAPATNGPMDFSVAGNIAATAAVF